MSRMGMGLCQGRFCWPALARKVAQECGASVEQVGPVNPRPPIRPVSMRAMAALEPLDAGEVD